MPNIKSAIKRVNIIEKKTLRNSMIKSDCKTAIRKFEAAVESGKKDEAGKLLIEATKKIDMACSKNIIKKNTASRKKSNLAKKLNAMSNTKVVKAATETTEKAKTTTTKTATAKKTTTTKKTTTKK